MTLHGIPADASVLATAAVSPTASSEEWTVRVIQANTELYSRRKASALCCSSTIEVPSSSSTLASAWSPAWQLKLTRVSSGTGERYRALRGGTVHAAGRRTAKRVPPGTGVAPRGKAS